MGWLVDGYDFKYRIKITVTEQSGNNLTNYAIRINLNSTNFNFSHFLNNGNDIRFTDDVGNLLDYWVELMDLNNKKAIRGKYRRYTYYNIIKILLSNRYKTTINKKNLRIIFRYDCSIDTSSSI